MAKIRKELKSIETTGTPKAMKEVPSIETTGTPKAMKEVPSKAHNLSILTHYKF
jgi:hypothetical protein